MLEMSVDMRLVGWRGRERENDSVAKSYCTHNTLKQEGSTWRCVTELLIYYNFYIDISIRRYFSLYHRVMSLNGLWINLLSTPLLPLIIYPALRLSVVLLHNTISRIITFGAFPGQNKRATHSVD